MTTITESSAHSLTNDHKDDNLLVIIVTQLLALGNEKAKENNEERISIATVDKTKIDNAIFSQLDWLGNQITKKLRELVDIIESHEKLNAARDHLATQFFLCRQTRNLFF